MTFGLLIQLRSRNTVLVIVTGSSDSEGQLVCRNLLRTLLDSLAKETTSGSFDSFSLVRFLDVAQNDRGGSILSARLSHALIRIS